MTLLKKIEKSDGATEVAKEDAIKHFALFNVLGGQKEKEKTIGGIPWSTLQIKRKDKSFNHMEFWKTLSEEDQTTLMEMLRGEKASNKSKQEKKEWAA